MADEPATDPNVAPNDPPAVDPAAAPPADPAGNQPAGDPPADPPAVEPTWPEDWRAKVAGDDEKALKRLERFQSPADVFKSYRALEQRMGEMKAPLPEKPTDDQVAEYRKANGIPEKPEGYLDNLPNGIVVGEDDKPILSAFAEKMHAKHAPPELVSEAVAWYYSEQEERMAALVEEDRGYKQKAEDELRAEWGNEYRANVNTFSSFLDTAPEGMKDMLLQGRLADGSVIGNNPEFMRWIVSMAREINPASTVVPGAGANAIDSVQEEIAKIEKVMRSDRAAYNKDEKMQARYRDLLEAEEKMKARAA